MPDDKILTWPDYAEEATPAYNIGQENFRQGTWAQFRQHYAANYAQNAPERRISGYLDYLRLYHWLFWNTVLPAHPADTEGLPEVKPHISQGRWVWQCENCGAAYPVDPDFCVYCVQCGEGGWQVCVYPDNKADIEADLLTRPGHRLNAPTRNWEPG